MMLATKLLRCNSNKVTIFRFSSNLKPVITIPTVVQERAEKRQRRLRSKVQSQSHLQGDKFWPIITCKRKELNHYANQTYLPYKTLPLASEHWHNRKRNGDYFTIHAFTGSGHRNEKTAPSFEELSVDPTISEALSRCGFARPTLIQTLAIPVILDDEDENCIIASETGNGKTLAFLVPIMQLLLKAKESNPSVTERPQKSPLALIVTPGKELSYQIYRVAQNLADFLKISVSLVSKSHTYEMKSSGNVDLVIGSFGSLVYQFQRKQLKRQFVRHIVFDEADTLLDDTFNDDTVPFLRSFAKGRGAPNLTLVAATFPTSLTDILRDAYSAESFTKITTPSLHRVLPHVRQKFIKVAADKKPEMLLDLVSREVAKTRPTLIFCNKSSTALFLFNFLAKHNIDCASYHSQVVPQQRQTELDDFTTGRVPVMVATDLASRGIDTFNVGHVINYDFPLNLADYIHRVGRVGRVSSKGPNLVTNFVRGGTQTHLVKKIEEAVRTNSDLPGVNNNIIRIIKHQAKQRAIRNNEVAFDDDESDEE